MKINEKLNLVTTVEGEKGKVFVHSAPFSREMFELYFLPMSKAFSLIYQEGLSITAGPRVAALAIKKVSIDLGVWEGRDGVQEGFFRELRRLTNVIVNTENGWETLPWKLAVDREYLTDDDVAEIEGAVTFFILASAMHSKTMLAGVLNSMCGLWGQQITLLNVTGYADSLRNSIPALATPTATPDAEVPALSFPS